MEEIYDFFSVIKDPRKQKGKQHKMSDIIIMSIFAILSGKKDSTEIEYFLKLREEYFTNLLNLKHGVPSHDTISWVFRIINPKQFMNIFIKWTKKVIKTKSNKKIDTKKLKIIPIDGKAIKSATDKVNNGNIPYIVSAFSNDIGISIGEVKVDSKTNEIKAIPELLDLIDITGCIITIDAMGCQKDIVKKIVDDKKAHYCLSVKNNHKSLYVDIDEYFKYALEDKSEISNIKSHTTINKEHGRIERRDCYITNSIYFINDKEKWCNLKSIGLIRNYREINNDVSIEDRYYISDLDLSAENLGNIVRNHWSIENNLHWILDVHFREDLSLGKKDYAIENFSTVRKICYNLVKLDTSFGDLPVKKKLMNYEYNPDTIKRLMLDVISNL